MHDRDQARMIGMLRVREEDLGTRTLRRFALDQAALGVTERAQETEALCCDRDFFVAIDLSSSQKKKKDP